MSFFFFSFSLSLMMQVAVASLLLGLVCRAAEPPASQWSGEEGRNLTLRRLRTCVENEQYLNQGLCCLNCKEGKKVKVPAACQETVFTVPLEALLHVP